MRIVALVPGGIGDQILFFPTLDDLKRNYPDAEIDVVAEPRSLGAYRICKSVSNVLKFDFKDRNSLTEWVDLIGNIRDREYDIAICAGQRPFVGMALWLSGVAVRVSYQGGGNLFLTNSVPLKTEQYVAAMYHDLLKGLGISTPCPDLTINVPKSDLEWADKEQQRLGIKDSGYILIHGGSSQLAAAKTSIQTYPAQSWRQVIQNLQQRQPDLPIAILVQTAEEEQLVRSLQEAFPDLKVTNPPDIGKTAAIVAAANLLLCTDSAPMHLAVAVQTYTIALFGATDPKKVVPPSDRFIAIKSPTGKLSDIAPQTVLERVWGG